MAKIRLFRRKKKSKEISIKDVNPGMANHSSRIVESSYRSNNVYYHGAIPSRFDGEKEMGDIGLLRNYRIDYKALSKRVDEALLIDDIAKALVNRYSKWIVSKGLTLEYKPKKLILELNNVDTSKIEDLNDTVEAHFDMWAKSKDSCFRKSSNFYEKQKDAFKSAIANGDVLTVLRYSKKQGVTVELINTQRLMTPIIGNENWRDGIRYNEEGEVVEFCVASSNSKNGYVTIKARNSQGLLQAFLYKIDKHRIEDERGLSKLSGSLNKLSKLDRYIEATVATAEERAKIAYSIEHDIDSSGENPLTLAKSSRGIEDSDSDPVDIKREQLASTVSATTGSTAINMVPGSKLEMHDPKTDIDSDKFVSSILNIISASVGIPPNVVMMLYNDSFSASRAAINDWQHTISVDREEFMRGWLLPIFVYWLRVEVSLGTLNIPAYSRALNENNHYLIRAYENVEFVGEMFPHIDPLKEVRAERAKLGPRYRNVPLTTHERATRALGNADAGDVIQQTTDEIEKFENYDEGMKEIEYNRRSRVDD